MTEKPINLASLDLAAALQEAITLGVVDCLDLVDEDARGEAGGVWRWCAIQ